MEIKNNPTLEKNIEIVADWIENDSNDRKKEIKWLLSKLFAEQVEWVAEADHIRTLNEDITNVYASVMEHSESEANNG
jgi:malonyl CoA-acyl carrier protein transacylase